MIVKHLRFSLANNWYVAVIACGSIFVVSLILLYKLGSLTGGLSQSEYELWQSVHGAGMSLPDLLRSAVNLPYDFVHWLLQYTPFNGNGSLRLPGVLFGFIGVLGMFALLKRWYSVRVAYCGAALFLCSSWLLHSARFASADALYTALPIVLALWAWVIADTRRHASLGMFCVAAAATMYIPGMAWILIPAFIWQRHSLIRAFRRVNISWAILVGMLTVALLLPLITSLLLPLQGGSLGFLRELLGLPASIPSLSQIATNAINIPKELFIVSGGDPISNLARLPLLDVFATVMFVIGLYTYTRDWQLDRTKFITAGLVVGSVLVTLGGIPIVILLPFVYLVAIAGAGYLLQQWLEVFPRNPFARPLGIGLVVITLSTAIVYQLTNYFVAWPRTPATKSTFVQRISVHK